MYNILHNDNIYLSLYRRVYIINKHLRDNENVIIYVRCIIMTTNISLMHENVCCHYKRRYIMTIFNYYYIRRYIIINKYFFYT